MPIRPATDADLDELVRLRLAFIADLRGVDPTSYDDEYVAVTRAFFVDTMSRDVIRSWFATDDDRTNVGIVSLLLADVPPLPERRLVREGYVINLWVEPAHRRRGIARALMHSCFEANDELHLRGFHLHATDEGRPLYESEGFVDDTRFMVRMGDLNA